MTPKEKWRQHLELAFFYKTNQMPMIMQGTDPYRDVDVVQSLSERHIVWFYYDMHRYTPDYWNVFLLRFLDRGDFLVNLSTAFDISSRLGFETNPFRIPALWVLNVDHVG